MKIATAVADPITPLKAQDPTDRMGRLNPYFYH